MQLRNGSQFDQRRARLQLRNGLEFHRVIDTQPTVLHSGRSRYTPGQVAAAGQVARTTTHRTRKPSRVAAAERFAVRSSDLLRDGLQLGSMGTGLQLGSPAGRMLSKLTYHPQTGGGCAKKPSDSSPSGRTPPGGQGEPLKVRKTSATLRTKCAESAVKMRPRDRDTVRARVLPLRCCIRNCERVAAADRVGVPSSDQLRAGTRCTTLDPWGPGCSCGPGWSSIE